MLAHIVPRAAAELAFFKRSCFTKNVTKENNWSFELGVGDGFDIPVCAIVGLLLRG